ncbi:hypothetical protein [Streptomyces sp. NK08204]|uniref:hypothetical protein n=1 Tax=Streptomyces sp. NK08204 TaxID=2873260 RepID=UPI001CED504B|nr:hypothetical protein [Streptomyces sp. NK08204]
MAAEVETLPVRRGPPARPDPAGVVAALDQAGALFQDRRRPAHRDSPTDSGCRSHARLPDAVSGTPATAPDDLSRHLATCPRCVEATTCLRPYGGALPAAPAEEVIGREGLAHPGHRRRAAEVRPGTGRPGTAAPPTAHPQLNGSPGAAD